MNNDFLIQRIKIKELKKEEIEKIVELYNKSFGSHRASLLRNTDEWLWRYKNRPNSDEDIIVVAKDNDKIVGGIILTFRDVNIKDKIYKFGMIDDVSTLPEYRGRGIARKIINNIIDYLKEKNIPCSALYADPNYIAIKLYASVGYKNIFLLRVVIYPAHPFKLFIDIPYLFPIAPIFILWHYIVKFLLHIKSVEKELVIEKLKVQDVEEIISLLNKSYSKFIGFNNINKEYFLWKHLILPKNKKNIFLVAKEKNKIVGGISLITQRARFKSKKTMYCFINELFYNDKNIAFALLKETFKYSSYLESPIICFNFQSENFELLNIAKEILALPLGKGVFMIQDFSYDFPVLNYSKEVWYVMNESATGIP